MLSLLVICLSLASGEPNLRGAEPLPRDLLKCGVPGFRRHGERIMHGKSAEECKWRWQVSLHDSRLNASSHFCGGTLIDPKWVLTAAHCVGSYSRCDQRFMSVAAGEWRHGAARSMERKVKRILTHPKYCSEAPSDFDFALLELEEALPSNECIGVACLPSNADLTETSCSITGWGTVGGGQHPVTLQEASVTTLSSDLCTKRYAEQNTSITSSMMCASGLSESGVTDACYGDSGGPLVCQEGASFVVRGVTSWGFGCASERFPGVYARVTSAMPWIREAMSSKPDVGQVDFHGSMWAVTKGACVMDAQGCITTPNYPSNYSVDTYCAIAVNTSGARPILVEDFSTEPAYDQLLVNCESFSGVKGPEGVTPFTDLWWVSDGRTVGRGWKLCPGI